MKPTSTIGVWVCILMILLGNSGVANVLLPPYILSQAKNDSWVSVLVALPFALIWSLALWYILRKLNGAPIAEWLSKQFGPFLSWLIRLPVILLLFMQATSSSWETGHVAAKNYMSNTPVWIIIFVTIMLCMWTAHSGLRSIAFTSVILFPVASLIDVMLLGVTYTYQDFRLLFPVLENGFQPALKGAYLAAGGMINIWLLLWVQQEVRGAFKWWQPLGIVLYMAWLELIPIVLGLTILGEEQVSHLRGPLLEVWRVASLGNTIEHIDLFAIVQRTAGNFTRLSLQLYLISNIAGFKKPLHRAYFLFAISLGIGITSSIPVSDRMLTSYLINVQYPFILILVPLLTIAFAFMVKRKPPNPSLKEATES
ncbi:spore germination protein [Paenibacillus pasadenensis]|uniref:GerAB/ArcD/ProY family transporter n=1 Tax=Paenibacillus pasadenensis TaxID=217090 RepID=UPI00203E1279|nr:GerAB/ArcD/ProY family transporter [Paenibacillus pasadenensis]MCM3749291.1 spore germination protein [Paenibacillus pasadenensis]